MLNFLMDATFDQMMDLNNEEVKNPNKKHAADGAGSAMDSRDRVLVQTQSELYGHNQSELKDSIMKFSCVVGKGGQCLYKDATSLLAGKMNLASKKKLAKINLLKVKGFKTAAAKPSVAPLADPSADQLTMMLSNTMNEVTKPTEPAKKLPSSVFASSLGAKTNKLAEQQEPERNQNTQADMDVSPASTATPHQLQQQLTKGLNNPIDKTLAEDSTNNIMQASSKKTFDNVFNTMGKTDQISQHISNDSKLGSESEGLKAIA
jgi:hypothetical protein